MQRPERADREPVAQHAPQRAIAAILLRHGAHRRARPALASRRGFPSTDRTGNRRPRRAARRRPSSRGCRRASSPGRLRRAGPSAPRARGRRARGTTVFHSNQNSNRSPLIRSDAARPGSARRNESSRRSVCVRRVTEVNVGDDVRRRGEHAVSLHGAHRLYKRVGAGHTSPRDDHSELRASMPLTHATELRVRYAETDRMGVVYYANYPGVVRGRSRRVHARARRKLRGAGSGGHGLAVSEAQRALSRSRTLRRSRSHRDVADRRPVARRHLRLRDLACRNRSPSRHGAHRARVDRSLPAASRRLPADFRALLEAAL